MSESDNPKLLSYPEALLKALDVHSDQVFIANSRLGKTFLAQAWEAHHKAANPMMVLRADGTISVVPEGGLSDPVLPAPGAVYQKTDADDFLRSLRRASDKLEEKMRHNLATALFAPEKTASPDVPVGVERTIVATWNFEAAHAEWPHAIIVHPQTIILDWERGYFDRVIVAFDPSADSEVAYNEGAWVGGQLRQCLRKGGAFMLYHDDWTRVPDENLAAVPDSDTRPTPPSYPVDTVVDQLVKDQVSGPDRDRLGDALDGANARSESGKVKGFGHIVGRSASAVSVLTGREE